MSEEEKWDPYIHVKEIEGLASRELTITYDSTVPLPVEVSSREGIEELREQFVRENFQQPFTFVAPDGTKYEGCWVTTGVVSPEGIEEIALEVDPIEAS